MKLGRKFNEINEDHLYGFGLAKGESEAVAGDFLGAFVTAGKVRLLTVIVLLGLGVIGSKALFLQIIRGSYYVALAESNRAKIEYLRPSRGIIYDSRQQPLVSNVPLFDAVIIPALLPSVAADREKRIADIGALLGEDPMAIQSVLANYPANVKQPIAIKEGISYDTALQYIVQTAKYPGLNLEISTQREYENPQAFAHLLGYEGKITTEELDQQGQGEYLLNDTIGKSGLELSYEKQLRGTLGYREIEVDAAGREKKILSEKPAVNGTGIKLAIDSRLQDFVAKQLNQQLRTIGKKRGVVVALDPRNGEIRAMVSLPGYDDNLFARGISPEAYKSYVDNPDNPLFNRAIKGSYPSGSTVKLVVGAAALTEHVVSESTSFLSTGGIWYANKWFFPDWKAGGHGQTNITKAIADSVNTYFYIVGGGYKDFNGLGLDRLTSYYKTFGLGRPTGIDLPHEAAGLVPTREWKEENKHEEWYIGDTYHLSIGQGDLLVTPLQVAQYTMAFANGGTIYTPSLVESYIDADGQEVQKKPVISASGMVDDYAISVIKKAMRRGVTQGSSKYMNSLPVDVAGKTGTAEFDSHKATHAWFTGFAPYDKPELVVTVLIEEGGEGSSVSVPLAYKIFQYYFGDYKK